MALVNEFPNRHSIERNRLVLGERQRPLYGLAALLPRSWLGMVPLAPGLYALDNELVNRMEVATLDLF
jgi:hypothetical protein